MKTAAPDLSDTSWMDDAKEFQDDVTKGLEKLQRQHCRVINTKSEALKVFSKIGMAEDVIAQITGFLGPRIPVDMRVAIFDDEENSARIRAGDFTERAMFRIHHL